VLANIRDVGASDTRCLEDMNVPVAAEYVGWMPLVLLVLENMRNVDTNNPCTECWVLVPSECGCGIQVSVDVGSK
jgi:hypothetical protein